MHLPETAHPPVVSLFHGGFWRAPHGRDQLEPVAHDLAARGFAVWNVGYRRVGEPGGGWPGTLADAAAAVDHLARMRDAGIALDLARVIVVGHSAGGQLALWVAGGAPGDAAGRAAAPGERRHEVAPPSRVRPVAAAGLAPVVDLAGSFARNEGDGAVRALMGGDPRDLSSRYAAASPLERLPLGVPQLIVHGDADAALPVEHTRHYVRTARGAGDRVQYGEIRQGGHMEFLDPRSEGHRVLADWLECFRIASGG